VSIDFYVAALGNLGFTTPSMWLIHVQVWPPLLLDISAFIHFIWETDTYKKIHRNKEDKIKKQMHREERR